MSQKAKKQTVVKMKITTARRISQIFFVILFFWFCVVATMGTEFWRLRGWSVNWFLNLDPLAAIGAALATRTLYRGMVWAVATIVLTIIFGRFFCGWVCPFGAMHQFFGWLGAFGKKISQRIERNKYRKAQSIKYFLLVLFLIMAAFPLWESVSLQTGLLDPIPFVYRSVNLVLIPILDSHTRAVFYSSRQYDGAWLLGTLFLAALFLNIWIPRFYCRFICPLGALLGVLGRFSIWRIGKTKEKSRDCRLCEKSCEGACQPSGKIRISECVLCFNCLHICPDNLIAWQTQESSAGEIINPDIGRRGFILSAVSGLLAVPIIRLAGTLGTNWHHKVIRPPGALAEVEFLKRCLKCGQCMRICPTNVIVPSGIEGGLENLWTPVLNFRSGTSGCQLNCTACGFICPTAAIRPITLSEKLGLGEFSEKGPIRMGTAFVDRSRCLPWSMNTPCIVCQENCPMTPKAIYLEEQYSTVRDGVYEAASADGAAIRVNKAQWKPEQYAAGDYFCEAGGRRARIISNSADTLILEEPLQISAGDRVVIKIHLYAPMVDIARCIGCGICEHECPVSGLRAIRVSAENESRNRNRSLFLKN